MATAGMYLRIQGIKGESATTGYEGDIELESLDWGMHAGTFGDGSPQGAASMRTVNVLKKVDSATAALFQYLDQHKVVSKAKLTVLKAGGNPLPFVVIDMTQVRIITVDVSSAGPDLHERVSLSCETLTINYTPQASTGDLASAAMSYTTVKSPK